MAERAMIRVNLSQISPSGGHNSIVEMPGVPRVGEDIFPFGGNGDGYQVRAVLWVIGDPKYDVQVRFR